MHFRYGTFPFLLVVLFACIGSSGKVSSTVMSSRTDIVYEVFVQSFCDSNADGIGDLPGLISKLDYIKDLGATALWIMPVHPSPSYHKYDVSDFYAIHPDYGTMEDMRKLIREVHGRDMKIILDLVINHTSSEHAWFVASSSSPENPFRNYYVWRDFESVKDEIEKKSTSFDSDNLTQWHTYAGQDDRYYGFFWKGMPDLNFDHPPLREEIYKIGTYWLKEGIDGFRLDAAKHIYPDDRLEDTRKFWEEFRKKMEAVKPDVKLIGEVWSDPITLSTLFSGLPSLFNFELTKLIPDCIQSHDPKPFIHTYQAIQTAYKASGHPFEDAILLSNHDMNRIRSTLGNDLARTKLAASILLTLPGTPYIYYGEEIGMLGMKPDKHLREPFLWDEKTEKANNWIESQFSKSPDVIPLASQIGDSGSIFQHYKKWIRWRSTTPSLKDGDIQLIPPEYPNVLAFMRFTPNQRVMVIHNLNESAVELRVMDDFESFDATLKQTGEHTIQVPAYGSVLLRMKK